MMLFAKHYVLLPKILFMETASSTEKTRFMFNQSAILGLILVIFYAILYFTGKLFNSFLGNISFLIWCVFVYISSVKFRDNYCNGFIRYSKVFSYGWKLILLSSVIVGFFHFVIFKIDDVLLTEYIDTVKDTYLQAEFPESIMENMDDVLAKSLSWIMFFSAIFSGFLYGIFVSLITSIFVKRKPDPFNEGS